METGKPHILVVDDDPGISDLLAKYLSQSQMRVSTASNSAQMRAALKDSVIDLVMLDLRLGDEDGMQLARDIRATSQTPVIIVTGVQDEADRVMGLESGADDYVVKPFSNREVLARVRAVLRRYHTRKEMGLPATDEPKPRAFRFAGWELNVVARRLTAPDGHRVELSNGEFNLLIALCEGAQRVLSRDQLLDLSRLHGAEVYDRSIDVQILRLRRKIEEDPTSPKFICTERGVGYVFAPQVEILR